jgi:hypothetical protein
VLGLFGGMVLLAYWSRDLRLKWFLHLPEEETLVVVDGAIFALLGLVLALTFSGAASRFDERRHLVIQEVNAIGTAYLRLDLLTEASRQPAKDSFRRYVDSRIRYFSQLPDFEGAEPEFQRSKVIQREIWQAVLPAARESQAATMLLVPALNEMFDITTTRALATKIHPPFVVYGLLFGLALICSIIAGNNMARAEAMDWPRIAGFAAVVSLTIYITYDLEYPRLGLIQVTAIDQALKDLRASLN